MTRCVFTRCANPPSGRAKVASEDGIPVLVQVCTEHRLAIARVTDESVANAALSEPPVSQWASA